MRILLIFLPLLLSSCLKTDIVYGNGKVATQTDTLSEFSGKLAVDLCRTIIIDSGAPEISLTIDENLRRYIIIDTTEGNISISQDKDYNITTTEFALKVSLPNLNEININNAVIHSAVTAGPQCTVSLSGNAEYEGAIHADKADITLLGNSAVKLSGAAADFSLILKSDRSQDFSGLDINNAEVDIESCHSVKLTVYENITGQINGEGNLILSLFTPFNDVREGGRGTVIYPELINESLIHIE